MRLRLLLLALFAVPVVASKAERIAIWPDLAPGESVKHEGAALPKRGTDQPPITRVEKITHPTLEAYLPEGGGNGAAVLVLPGGGFGYVVPDLEGSETAAFLNPLGVSVFVLSYRTKLEGETEMWRRPLQDSQRAIRFLRENAARWHLDPEKIGLLAFSAGGQVGAVQIGEIGDAYEKVDALDDLSARPDFALLIYPWNVGDNASGELMGAIKLTESAPPTFLVHTDDDKSSALGAASIYMQLKKAGVSAELHIYQNGGHGYGVRERDGSVIGSWKDRAADWLRVRGLASADSEPLRMVPDVKEVPDRGEQPKAVPVAGETLEYPAG
jgi:acetyl esterase/lipase